VGVALADADDIASGNARFGAAVAVHESTVVVGAPGGSGGGGTVWVYNAGGDGGGGLQVEARLSAGTVLAPPSAISSAALGTSVAVYGDTLVAGAPGALANVTLATSASASSSGGAAAGGIATVFEAQTDTAGWRRWVPTQVLSLGDGRASGAAAGVAPGFGCAVALDFGVLAVAACGAWDGTGLVQLYAWSSAAARWVASPAGLLSTGLPSGTHAAFGTSLALHGVHLAVGAPQLDRLAAAEPDGIAADGSPPPGAVFLYAVDVPAGAARLLTTELGGPRRPAADTGCWWNVSSSGGGVAWAGVSAGAAVAVAAVPFSLAVTLPQGSAPLPSSAANSSQDACADVVAGTVGSVRALAASAASDGYWDAVSDGAYPFRAGVTYAPAASLGGDWPASGTFGAALAAGGATLAIGDPGAGGGRVLVTACARRVACDASTGTYTTAPCSAVSDAECAACSRGPCGAGYSETAACSVTADRVCTPTMEVEVNNATTAVASIAAAREGSVEVVTVRDTLPTRAEAWAQVIALRQLHDGMGGSHWHVPPAWRAALFDVTADACRLDEPALVQCNAAGWVTGLDLHGRHVTGTLPSAPLAALPYLTHLSLRDNFLAGPLPPALGAVLPRLSALDVCRNPELSGALPPTLLHAPLLYLAAADTLLDLGASADTLAGLRDRSGLTLLL